jgi:hypothetical protein
MKTYRIIWTIDVDANNANEAAQMALEIHRDPNGIATQFEVFELDSSGTPEDFPTIVDTQGV